MRLSIPKLCKVYVAYFKVDFRLSLIVLFKFESVNYTTIQKFGVSDKLILLFNKDAIN